MRIVLDTNVFVSGVFFKGPPYRILDAWRHGTIDLVVSPEILEEYHRIGAELQSEFPEIDLAPFLELLLVQAQVYIAPPLPEVVCRDDDDDKF